MHPALKGFHCLAVYDRPLSEAEQAAVAAPAAEGKKNSKKGKKAAAAASASTPAPLTRSLYYKLHSAAAHDESVKAGCTLFVVNIPFSYSEHHLMQLFACFGAVESASFLQSPSLSLCSNPSLIGAVSESSFYRSAHVVFEEEDSAQMAISTDLSDTPQQCAEEVDDDMRVGMKKWLSSYHSSHPSISSLQLQVDRFMEGFDARAAAERAARSRGGSQPDAEGWTLVRGASKGHKRALVGVEEETARAQERAAKKLKKNTVLHFYKNQEREEKKQRLVQLREKFEQDKLKIAKMKQDRKFKPY